MLEKINDFSIIILEALSVFVMFDVFCVDNIKDNSQKKFSLFFCLYLFLSLLITGVFSNLLVIKLLLMFVLIAFTMFLYKSISLVKSCILTLFYIVFASLGDIGVYFFIRYLFKSIILNENGDVLIGRMIVLTSRLVFFIVLIIIKIIFNYKSGHNNIHFEWIKYIFIPIITVAALIIIPLYFKEIADMTQINVLYYLSFGMVVIDIYVYYLLETVVRLKDASKDKELELAQYKSQIDTYNTLESALEKQRQRSHEFKNHIMCIDSMVKNNDYFALEEYVKGLSQSEYVERKVITTNNRIIDTVINEKYYEMDKKGIVFVFKVNDLSGVILGNEDLVVLLSNLLDNAIEACEKCKNNKVISLKFTMEEDCIILSVKNTVQSLPEIKDDIFTTNKKHNTDEHGFGIKNIINVICKYNGTYSIDSDNSEFRFSIIIPL